jgi:hypothetical protein
MKPQFHIGFHRVAALFLKLIGFHLVIKAYAPAFLVQVDNYSLAFLMHHAHGFTELFPAVASVAAENIPGHAGGVHPDQHVSSSDSHCPLSSAIRAQGHWISE